ncbi:MAG: ABC transporter permease [Chloroflexota bacterium]
MTTYVIRRLLTLVPVVFVSSMIVFFMLRLFAPISIIEQTLADSPGAADPVVRERLKEEFGLHRPMVEQYVLWLWGAVRGDLGTSWATGKPVFQSVMEALPVSIEITLITTVLAVLIAIPLGVVSAVRQNTWMDYVSRFTAVAGLSVPNFVVATVLLLVPAMTLGWAPPVQYVPPWQDLGRHLTQMFLPILSLSVTLAAVNVRIIRSTLLEVIRNDFVRTARAKGLAERPVILGHALRNALIPAVTVLGTQLSVTLGGTVVIEQIYSLPGVGQLTLSAIQRGDFPQLQANILYLLVLYLLVNLLVDVSYGWIDPRIRFG